MDASGISHRTTPSATQDSRGTDAAPALAQRLVHIPEVNAAPTVDLAPQPSTAAIPSKRPYPFCRDEPRKKKKTGGYVNIRIYAERKDVEHTHEVQWALTPDGGLDLVSFSRKMKLPKCQASRLDAIRTHGLGGAHYFPKVLDARYSRPWVGKHPVLERGAVKLLKAKEGYLRVVGQAPPPVKDRGTSHLPSWQS